MLGEKRTILVYVFLVPCRDCQNYICINFSLQLVLKKIQLKVLSKYKEHRG